MCKISRLPNLPVGLYENTVESTSKEDRARDGPENEQQFAHADAEIARDARE